MSRLAVLRVLTSEGDEERSGPELHQLALGSSSPPRSHAAQGETSAAAAPDASGPAEGGSPRRTTALEAFASIFAAQPPGLSSALADNIPAEACTLRGDIKIET